MNEVKEDAVLDESITIIFNEIKTIHRYNNVEPDYENNCMKGLTLKDCLAEAKSSGYKSGTIMVLSESYLSGTIYRYNNYGKKEWMEIGTMAGFA